MDYIELLQKNLNQQSQESNLRKIIDDGFYKYQDNIIKLQINQIDNSLGFNNTVLYNPLFEGFYQPSTSNYALLGIPSKPLASKIAYNKYNFVWTGDFLSNFKIRAISKGFETYSTGTGSGGKKAFFDGYENMFGLTNENESTIYGEVYMYVMEKVLLNIYL